MASIRRRGPHLTLTVDGDEAALLRAVVGDVQALLEPPEDSGTGDPLEELAGLTDSDGTPPTDPVLARLLPDGYRDDPQAAAELRRLTEGSLRQTKSEAARQVLEDIPDGGGKITLGDDRAGAWLASLNDVRLVLGTRLGLSEESEMLGGYQPDEAGAAPYLIYHWLTGLQDELVTALSG